MQASAPHAAGDMSIRAAFDHRLEEVVLQVSHPTFRALLSKAVEGGKRVRPLLTCLSCEAAGGHARDAFDVAIAVELLHVASLVHDDIMDGSLTRRGRPTVARENGIPTAVLAGDMLLATAFRLVQHRSLARSGEIGKVLTDAFFTLCDGQAYDLLPAYDGRHKHKRHTSIVEKKTARLLEAAGSLGAMCAPCDDRAIRALGAFGYHVGMAYQAQDDLLDHVGDEIEVGKSVRMDARNGRTTFLTVAYARPDPVEAIRAEVWLHTEKACRALEVLPQSDARQALGDLASSLIDRRK
jgi:geranylgeranyl diphosphate synthase type I